MAILEDMDANPPSFPTGTAKELEAAVSQEIVGGEDEEQEPPRLSELDILESSPLTDTNTPERKFPPFVPKKKKKDIWATTSRKGKKKTKHAANDPKNPKDRLTASTTKGYKMVRATRGVTDGAWYFEIKVLHLGKTGHTRLGWSTVKGDLEAPVGFDASSYGYRDIDGSKVHMALRDKYVEEGYKEGDVIGFYINLPDGALYVPDPLCLDLNELQPCASATSVKEDLSKTVPATHFLSIRGDEDTRLLTKKAFSRVKISSGQLCHRKNMFMQIISWSKFGNH